MTLDEARTILCDMLVEDDQGVEQLRKMRGEWFTPEEDRALGVWSAARIDYGFVVMLRAVLMEHEGHETEIRRFSTRAEADAWIARQQGYFKPFDYYVAEVATP